MSAHFTRPRDLSYVCNYLSPDLNLMLHKTITWFCKILIHSEFSRSEATVYAEGRSFFWLLGTSRGPVTVPENGITHGNDGPRLQSGRSNPRLPAFAAVTLSEVPWTGRRPLGDSFSKVPPGPSRAADPPAPQTLSSSSSLHDSDAVCQLLLKRERSGVSIVVVKQSTRETKLPRGFWGDGDRGGGCTGELKFTALHQKE